MEFHPSQIPVSKTFHITNESQSVEIASEMVKLGFTTQKGAFLLHMTNDKKVAKKIGLSIMNELNFGLRKTNQERDVRYWIYTYDKEHFAMVLISSKVFQELGF